jgi:prevent-host-death family protein
MMKTATLRELNNNSSALARAAQAGDTVVITDRGTPIADIVPHRGLAGGVSRERFAAMVASLRALNVSSYNVSELRAEIESAVYPYDEVDGRAG